MKRETGPTGPKPRILVVDDERAILTSFRMLLTAEGYDVDTRETGRSAIEKAKGQQYDLAVIDIKLPDMEGTEVLSQLRKVQPRTRKVMITGYPSIDNAAASVNLGAHAYLVKPIKPDDFLRVVKMKLHDLDEEKSVSNNNKKRPG